MIVIEDIEQGTQEWHRARAGVVTASRAADFSGEAKLAPMISANDFHYIKDGKDHKYYLKDDRVFTGTNKAEVEKQIRETLPAIYSEARNGYCAELAGQIATGLIPEEMSFKQCEWGKDHEDVARALFEIETGFDVSVPAFIYRDENKRFGLSPDGLIDGQKIGLELKCPFTTKVFVEFLCCDKIKQEYYDQCQYSMWVTGYDAWYFGNYDPRVKTRNLHYVKIERDQLYMDKYSKAEKSFIKDMDSMLDKLGVKFGEQWNQ